MGEVICVFAENRIILSWREMIINFLQPLSLILTFRLNRFVFTSISVEKNFSLFESNLLCIL